MKIIAVVSLSVLLMLIPMTGVSCDPDSNGNEDEGRNADNTLPEISGITVSDFTETTATISWATDELATGNIEYDPDASYGFSYPSPADTTADTISHSLTLGDLSPHTTYHCKVKSRDSSVNEAISGDHIFTTDPPSIGNTHPVISSVTESDVTDTETIITWTTDEAATSQVEYGETDSYGSITIKDTDLVTIHSVTLTGLSADTEYHYRVKSKNTAGNEAISVDYSFYSLANIDIGKIVFCSTHDGNQ